MGARCDLEGIKEHIQNLFISANTTTGSPIDLSSNLTKRVQKVLKVHPAMIKPQASFYPYVTCYIAGKAPDITKSAIAIDQLTPKRMANLTVNVVCGVYNQNMASVDEDPADKDINYLAENAEFILRSSHDFSGLVKWQFPTNVEYYTGTLDQQTHLRAAIITLQATVYY